MRRDKLNVAIVAPSPALPSRLVLMTRTSRHRRMYRVLAILFGPVVAAISPVPADEPRDPGTNANLVDGRLAAYFAKHDVVPGELVPDRVFARRVYLDIIGLLPPVDALVRFEENDDPDKRARLVDELLGRRRDYADHWLTFWNDALRNAYRGTGYIDGGRAQITAWLYRALYENKPYDEFVHELVSPVAGSEGFAKGIVWRGVVNASQVPPMQAAQNVGQVLLGTNLKCASCHDSFINHWKLADAYQLASVFAEAPLEMHFCDKPIGEIAQPGFIYPELGTIDAGASQSERMRQLADILASPANKRLARTIVNRLWDRFFGVGIIEPLDDMDQPPWDAALLDAVADDLIADGWDLKHTIRIICTSRAYQLPAIDGVPDEIAVFRGPLVKRMSAEQFVDAVVTLTGTEIAATPEMLKPDGRGQGGQLAAVREVIAADEAKSAGATAGRDEYEASVPATAKAVGRSSARPFDEATTNGRVRAALAFADPLMLALGRPLREQVVTRRDSLATTLETLELTNGETLDVRLRAGAEHWLKSHADEPPAKLVSEVYRTALGRAPTDAEIEIAVDLAGSPPTPEGVADLLWAIVVLPEFQLIY